MTFHDNLDDCERYSELAALATAGGLTASDAAEVNQHIRSCRRCSIVYQQYLALSREGFGLLAALHEHRELNERWDDTATRRKLFARISQAEERMATPRASRRVFSQAAFAALAACLILAIGIVVWWRRSSVETSAKLAEASARGHLEETLSAKNSLNVRLAEQSDRISQLEAENSIEHQEADRLRTQLQELRRQLAGERESVRKGVDALTANKMVFDEQMRVSSSQHDRLSAQLHDNTQASQYLQTEIANLRAERSKGLLHQGELELRVNQLTTANLDQERRLADSEQYLLSDRDIRELMGARNLYIADVFDVDSSSRTRRPFGRVFYTKGKSLIFYAFDLDRQPRVKSTSAFQVWGQKETTHDQHERVRNLGMLYLDSETNRRWILRSDDPQTLAEIDAVFVTVEPHGGSAEPTGKPFLFAMLLKQANHP